MGGGGIWFFSFGLETENRVKNSLGGWFLFGDQGFSDRKWFKTGLHLYKGQMIEDKGWIENG